MIVVALGGIAIEIVQSSTRYVAEPKKYYNRKQNFALCVQIVVGADYKFTFLSTYSWGSTHDSTEFYASALHRLL